MEDALIPVHGNPRLFSLMIPKPKEKPPWSLRASGLLALGRTLSARIRVRDVHGKPWERPEWLRLKEYLLSGLTESLLRELYSLIFLNEDILIQPSWVLQFHQEISDLPGDKLFLLWWIFFDEVATTAHRTKEYELDNNFHLQQVTFLSSHCTNLEEVTVAYNWIVKDDYVAAFKNQKRLKHLGLVRVINSTLFRIIASHCKLDSITFYHPMDFQYVSDSFNEFLRSQKDTLKTLDLLPLRDKLNDPRSSPFISGLLLVLSSCRRLQELSIAGSILRVSQLAQEGITLESVKVLKICFQGHFLPGSFKNLLSVFPRLEKLDFCNASCQAVAAGGNLEHLALLLHRFEVDNMSPRDVMLVLPHLRRCTEIKMTMVRPSATLREVSEAAEAAILFAGMTTFPNLTSLKIFTHRNSYDVVFPFHLTQFLINAPKLRHFCLTCDTLIQMEFSNLIAMINSRSALTCLKTFQVTARRYVSDPEGALKLVKAMLVNLRNLETVHDLRWCGVTSQEDCDKLVLLAREKGRLWESQKFHTRNT